MSIRATTNTGRTVILTPNSYWYTYAVRAINGDAFAVIANVIIPNIIVDDIPTPTTTLTKLNNNGNMILKMVHSYTSIKRGVTTTFTREHNRVSYNNVRRWLRTANREDDRWTSQIGRAHV